VFVFGPAEEALRPACGARRGGAALAASPSQFISTARGQRPSRMSAIADSASRASASCWPLGCSPSGADEIAPSWMTVDAATQRVRLLLVGSADGANGTMNLQRLWPGRDERDVPFGWMVRVDFENKGLAAAPPQPDDHQPGDVRFSDRGRRAAFPRALTIRLVSGLLAGETDWFESSRTGGPLPLFLRSNRSRGRGMWDYLIVSKEAKVRVSTSRARSRRPNRLLAARPACALTGPGPRRHRCGGGAQESTSLFATTVMPGDG